ncbi:unnamed protein product (macronuclear) [Paramecium tetraurelia]|uniref:Uncharacterized protein n=1 Tax=Paramecium tetraurelia TaxID=5888 RepID=A0EC10_PARTE|nr:uncharacterized protein GSPATT00025563001 [Paramecium tetraurelia]CAK92827.1 unnamed protein product [Paramecium tetraurelia]|eukprot:XP_001460224.1 hypothetical protein (macronuclear) [Paramecium tetraurelia strain d4-2]
MSSVQHYLLRRSITVNKNGNIFTTQHEFDQQRLYRNGKIVPYYIIGNPEIMDKQLTIASQTEDSQTNTKTKTLFHKEHKPKVAQKPKNRVLEGDEFIKLDMEFSQVEDEIQQLQIQQKKGQINLPSSHFGQADRAAAEKDNRIMKSFEQQQKSWDKRVIQSAQRCKRQVSESIYNKIQGEREKNEDRKLLDLIQTDAERHGHKLWERQLRSTSEVLETNQKIQAQGLEIIKSMNSSGIYKRPKSFVKRFQERQDKVNELTARGNQIQNLQVEGLNQLAREASSLNKIIKDQKEIYQNILKNNSSVEQISHRKKYKAPFKKLVPVEKQNSSQDIISINYDKKTLGQQGKLEIYKQFF